MLKNDDDFLTSAFGSVLAAVEVMTESVTTAVAFVVGAVVDNRTGLDVVVDW